MIIDAHAHLFAPAALYTYRTNLVASRGQYGDFKQDVTGADFQKFADQNVGPSARGAFTERDCGAPR